MKIAILETGRPPSGLAEQFGDYPAMFGELLGEGFEVESYAVTEGRLPHPNAHAGYLIATG